MTRKNFISVTGLSLGGLMFNSFCAGEQKRIQYIKEPDEAWILTGNGLQKMEKSGDKFVYKDAEIVLKSTDDIMSVSLLSPVEAVKGARLKWKHTAPATAKLLGDHWERTYGDLSWHQPEGDKKMPWYFIQHNKNETTCFGVKTGCNSICYWNVNGTEMQLTLDTTTGGTGVQLGNRTLHAADIVATKNIAGETLFATTQRFCTLMCDAPRTVKQPVYGINDWYFSYGKNSSALILQHTSLLANLATDTNNRPFSVVDAGWAFYSPLLQGDCCWQDDFSRPNSNFSDMQKLATDINALDMRPGLWTRPLCAKHNDKANLLLPVIPGRNEKQKPVLDPTIEENIERIKSNISLYKSWGYEMIKHDFTTFDLLGKWGFEMKDELTVPGWKFNDSSKTNAEIILNLYQSIRDAAGDMYLIGCNTISHLSAGLFELNRIGDDTSGKEWDRTRKMGVNTLAFRMPQHRSFYQADADCVGLTNEVPWAKNKQWMQLLAESGTPLFISAQPDAVGAEQKEYIKQCFTTAAKKLPAGEPLDWMSTLIPASWKLNGKVVNFDWS